MTLSDVVLITRRYWPLVGGAERVMAALAGGLRELGVRPTIVTAQWERDWPRELVHQDTPVVRLPQPALRRWGTLRYMLGLARWLNRRSGQLEGAIVSMLKHDAYVALSALQRGGTPIVLRAEGGGRSGDCRWQEQGRFGARIRRRCQQAAAIVAPSPTIRDELLLAGYPASRVHFVANGVAIPETPPAQPQRSEARATLGEANADLRCAPNTALVVYTGRLDRRKGLLDLLDAWPAVASAIPDSRLWLIGEGPDREALYQKVSDLDLRGRVLLPGAFDQVDDILVAADVFVLPSYEEGMSMSLLEAMAAGLPVVASDIPGNRTLIRHAVQGLLAPPGHPGAWSAAILHLLQDVQLAAACGHQARCVAQQYSVQRMARAHVQLLDSQRQRRDAS